MNRILRKVKLKLGASARKLELSDDEIIEIIKENTMRTFSIYSPYEERVTIIPEKHQIKTLDKLDTYIIPTNSDIINIKELVLPSMGNAPGFVGIGSDMGIVDFDPQITPTTRFVRPNRLEVYPNLSQAVNHFVLIINVVHPDSTTVKLGLLDKLFILATGDVAEAILAMRNQFQDINSEFGAINLNIDYLQTLVSERNDLLQKFDDNLGLLAERKKVYFI